MIPTACLGKFNLVWFKPGLTAPVFLTMKHGSLFSGIGGFDLAAEWMGWENVFHCEWMEFPRKVLDYYWPDSDSLTDICKTDFKKYANKIDILTGGFPCQPYSSAGKRKGKEDERHLWPEMLRAIREIKPSYVVGENVFGLLNWNEGMVFDEVHTDLELEGYEVQAVVIPAAAVNAPHGRDRVWFVAHRKDVRRNSGNSRSKQEIDKNKNGIYEHRQKRGQVGAEFERLSKKQNATNTDGIRLESTTQGGNIQESTRTPQEERRNVAKSIKTNGIDGNATDTDGNGFNECNFNNEKQPSKRGEYAQRNVEPSDVDGNVTDPDVNGLQRGVSSNFNKQQRSEEINVKKCVSTHRNEIPFENFPTQPPVCSGDDGFSDKLDGITFSKWRAESIKGYGNAIVPQVAFEIFKAIEQTI